MTTWLEPHEQRAWRAYLALQARLDAALNRQLQAASGLSLPDYAVLVQLSESAEDRLRPYALVAALDWEQSRLSHQLGRMERRGLVVREACAEDRRGAYVVLTAEGRAALEQAAPLHADTVRRTVFAGMEPEDVRRLEEFATGVLARLEQVT
ncbi:MarR family transcriptional regulator [Motilibacter rhizosphaerae]|uniref:MarR family transcriptional regulator n=1 Tax=Motilibacter rhizosphaerae TaxID=598652 RepID=A0A4Q7NT81_9ACTN|nr:MarR family transcriptional regulator [Motilibacter rhizosphaerae]RZS89592.1 MarR family transcriptional regulator [Motilibacter rhizosphaerae]